MKINICLLLVIICLVTACKKNPPIICLKVQRTGTTQLSEGRSHLAAAGAGTKIVFAGGNNEIGEPSAKADIYDVVTSTWSVGTLTAARQDLAAASVGGKLFFAGGWNTDNLVYATVDVYDVNANAWYVAELSQARYNLAAAAAGTMYVRRDRGGPDQGCPRRTRGRTRGHRATASSSRGSCAQRHDERVGSRERER